MRQPGQRGKNAAAANCAPLSNTTAPPLCRASACHSGSTPAGAPPRRQSSTARERGFTSSTACPPQAKTGRKASRTAACTSAGRAGTGQVIPDGNMAYSQPGRRRTHWVSAPVSVCSVPHNSHPRTARLGQQLLHGLRPQLRQNQLRPKPGQRPAGGFFRQGGAPGGETCRRWNHGSSLRVVINGAKPVAFTPARCRGKDSMPEKYRQRPYSY